MNLEVPTEKKTASISRIRSGQRSFRLKPTQIRGFLKEIREDGRAENTIQKYRTAVNRFYDFLGEDKQVCRSSLPLWKEQMIAEGYAERSINSSVVAVNSLYDYLGCRDWQLFEWMELKKAEGEELTREEYLLLLEEAKAQEKIQLYLLIKVMACTDLTPGDMVLLTREAVNEGYVSGKTRGTKEDRLMIPECIRKDLLEYAMQHGIRSGTLFLNGNQKPLERTVITKYITQLGEDAGLAPGKANPRNLRRLHLNTLAEYRQQAEAWVAVSYLQLLTQEETRAGWQVR